VHAPPASFPFVEYDAVAMYTVNAKHYKDSKLPPIKNGALEDPQSVGFAILDSIGNPAYQYIDRIELSAVEKKELQSIFQLPENKGEIEKMMCVPYYRDAFVFYRDKKQVAQVQICFQCRQMYVSTDTSDLANRFTTDGDWDKLMAMVTKVKTRGKSKKE
jgi:hypothetical protein